MQSFILNLNKIDYMIAVITAINMYIASKICENLLSNNYIVYGIAKCNINLPEKHKNLTIHNYDISDFMICLEFFKTFENKEIHIYHFEGYETYLETTMESVKRIFISTISMLEAIKSLNINAKIFIPRPTEIFGHIQEIPQREITEMKPNTIHGILHLAAYWIIKYYRTTFNIFACNCILYTIESENNVNDLPHQILKTIQSNKTTVISNLDTGMDFLHIEDFLLCLEKVMKSNKSYDIIISSFQSHTYREYIELAFKIHNINIKWIGHAGDEKGVDSKTKRTLVRVNEKLRSNDSCLLGNNEKVLRLYNWTPQITFSTMVEKLVKKKKPNNFCRFC